MYYSSICNIGFLLILMLYCIYRRPEYHRGNYIMFTQTLYASRAYKIVAYCTFFVSIIVIIIGISLLIKYGNDWTQYIVALSLMVMASRNLLRKKTNGLDIQSEKFCQLKISRGNILMQVFNFFLMTNASLLDLIEVQFMKQCLPDDIAAPQQDRKGWSAFFTFQPLIETDAPHPTGEENKGESNDIEMFKAF